jgi:hypothetical protein
MKTAESPGALAALGASEIDQLGSTVDPRNSPTNLRTHERSGSDSSMRSIALVQMMGRYVNAVF